MNILFTRHAKNRMRWRKISIEEIELVIKNFDRKEYITQNKFHLFKLVNDRLLRVTAVIEENNFIILSVVDKHN